MAMRLSTTVPASFNSFTMSKARPCSGPASGGLRAPGGTIWEDLEDVENESGKRPQRDTYGDSENSVCGTLSGERARRCDLQAAARAAESSRSNRPTERRAVTKAAITPDAGLCTFSRMIEAHCLRYVEEAEGALGQVTEVRSMASGQQRELTTDVIKTGDSGISLGCSGAISSEGYSNEQPGLTISFSTSSSSCNTIEVWSETSL